MNDNGKQINVVLYARVSTGKQAEKDISIPDQFNKMQEYCSTRGYNVIDKFVDGGKSGTNDNRPAFQDMIQFIRDDTTKIKFVIVHSLSRAFRNIQDMAIYARELDKYQVRFISITQETDDSPMGRLMMHFIGIMDEYSSTENAKHVIRARHEAARRGYYVGGQPPFGYMTTETKIVGHTGNRKLLVINEEEAKIVKNIFDLYEGNGIEPGIGMKTIVARLNEVCLRRGNRWTVQTVQRVLSDNVYTGIYEFGNRSRIRKTSDDSNDEIAARSIPIPVPQIIEVDRFQRVDVRRKSRSPRNKPPLHVTPKTLLTGLCKCGYCGCPMHISTGKSGQYRYLKCNDRNVVSNTICRSPNVPYEKFEKLVLECVIDEILTEANVNSILEDCIANIDKLNSDSTKEKTELFAHRTEIERKLTNLYSLIEQEKTRIDSTLSKRLAAWQDDLETTTAKLNSLKVKVALPPKLLAEINLTEFRSALVETLSDSESEDAKAFMHLFVDEIRIYGDEVTLKGSNLGIIETAMSMGTSHGRSDANSVPSFVGNWRRGRDSNPRMGRPIA
jgi:site-specific DNA recombinase